MSSPKTIAMLEEHNVTPGTPLRDGAVYIVPRRRKATLTAMFGKIQSDDQENTSNVLLAIVPPETIKGPDTPYQGMNPLHLTNGAEKQSVQINPGPITIFPDTRVAIMFHNSGPNAIYMNVGLMIFEEDLY